MPSEVPSVVSRRGDTYLSGWGMGLNARGHVFRFHRFVLNSRVNLNQPLTEYTIRYRRWIETVFASTKRGKTQFNFLRVLKR